MMSTNSWSYAPLRVPRGNRPMRSLTSPEFGTWSPVLGRKEITYGMIRTAPRTRREIGRWWITHPLTVLVTLGSLGTPTRTARGARRVTSLFRRFLRRQMLPLVPLACLGLACRTVGERLVRGRCRASMTVCHGGTRTRKAPVHRCQFPCPLFLLSLTRR